MIFLKSVDYDDFFNNERQGKAALNFMASSVDSLIADGQLRLECNEASSLKCKNCGTPSSEEEWASNGNSCRACGEAAAVLACSKCGADVAGSVSGAGGARACLSVKVYQSTGKLFFPRIEKMWHYASGGHTTGPAPESQVVAGYRDRSIPLESLVWCDGMSQWAQASATEPFKSLPVFRSPPPIPSSGSRPPPLSGHPASPIPPLAEAIRSAGTLIAGAMTSARTHPPAGMGRTYRPITSYGTAHRRIMAQLLDVLLLAITGIFISKTGDAAVGIIFIGYFLYNAGMEASPLQGSIGKILTKLKVEDLSGNRITFWRALGRNAGKYLSGAIFYIGFLMIIWDAKKQGLHDKMAKCVVVSRT